VVKYFFKKIKTMKNLLLILAAFALVSFNNPCYRVTSVIASADAPDMKKERVIFGIKQLTEEIISEKYELCTDGSPIVVDVFSIEAPTTGVSIGPFTAIKKETIIKVKITKDGKDYIGEGAAKTTVKSTLIELKDENLPFEKTTFASAVKKSLLDAVSKM
jgi:hypothetical protein